MQKVSDFKVCSSCSQTGHALLSRPVVPTVPETHRSIEIDSGFDMFSQGNSEKLPSAFIMTSRRISMSILISPALCKVEE